MSVSLASPKLEHCFKAPWSFALGLQLSVTPKENSFLKFQRFSFLFVDAMSLRFCQILWLNAFQGPLTILYFFCQMPSLCSLHLFEILCVFMLIYESTAFILYTWKHTANSINVFLWGFSLCVSAYRRLPRKKSDKKRREAWVCNKKKHRCMFWCLILADVWLWASDLVSKLYPKPTKPSKRI